MNFKNEVEALGGKVANVRLNSSLLAFIYLSSAVFIGVDARVYPAEILLVTAALILSLKGGTRDSLTTALLLTGTLWFCSVILSNYATSAPLGSGLKGTMRAAFVLLDFLAFFKLIPTVRNNESKFLLGMGIAGLSSYFFYPSDYALVSWWKFGLGVPVTLLIFFFLGRTKGTFKVKIFWILALATFHFFMGDRSLAITTALSGFFVILSGWRWITSRKTIVVALISLCIVSICSVFVTSLYDSLARTGMLGSSALDKISIQSQGAFGSLATGREEFWLSLDSISQNPLFGVGSYQFASPETMSRAAALLENWGYSASSNSVSDTQRSFHSELFGMIAENGILAAPFWIVVGAVFTLGLVAAMRKRDSWSHFYLFIAFTGLWDLLFSPIGADRKIWLAATLALTIANIRRVNREN